jgi:hypothetical protein
MSSPTDVPPEIPSYKRIKMMWKDSEGRWESNENDKPVSTDTAGPDDSFAIVRYFKPSNANLHTVTVEIQIWSKYIIEPVQKVMKDVRNVSWAAKPVKVLDSQLTPCTMLSRLTSLYHYIYSLFFLHLEGISPNCRETGFPTITRAVSSLISSISSISLVPITKEISRNFKV